MSTKITQQAEKDTFKCHKTEKITLSHGDKYKTHGVNTPDMMPNSMDAEEWRPCTVFTTEQETTARRKNKKVQDQMVYSEST